MRTVLTWSLLALVIAGCSGPKGPPALVTSQPKAIFPTVADAAKKRVTFVFTNSGGSRTGPLSTELSGDAAFTVGWDGCLGIALGANQQCPVTLELQSDASGAFRGLLRVFSVPDALDAEVELEGEVADAALELSATPTTADPDALAVAWLEVRNRGGVVSGPIAVTLPPGVTDDGNGCSGARLAGGASCSFTVTTKTSLQLGSFDAGTVTASATPGGSGSANVVILVGDNAALDISSAELGNVVVGLQQNVAVTITNIGGRATQRQLRVWLDMVSPASPQWVGINSNDCDVAPLLPGASCTVRLLVAPSAAGEYSATIRAEGGNTLTRMSRLHLVAQ